MRILQITSAQSFGGGERYVSDLANSLVALGHEVYAIVRPNSPVPRRLTDVPEANVRSLPLRNALDVTSANDLARFVKQHDIEIIHAHMARDYSLAAYAARRNRAAKLIVTRHVLFPLNRLHSRTLRSAARVIAVSEAVARQLRDLNLLPAARISIVRNGVDVDRLQWSRQTNKRGELCRDWGIPDDSFLIGTVGQLNPLKGHDVFLKAAAMVRSSLPHARFIIAGEDASPRGETLFALKGLIADLNLQDHVRLLGQLEEIAPLLAALDVFVSASQTESFGLAMAEAMATSLPVVATDTAGAREVVKDGETGFVVAVGDTQALGESIMRLGNDAKLRERMGELAYQDANARFQLKRMVKDVEQIYMESLSE